jgi:nucleoid-associated protein YgaU
MVNRASLRRSLALLALSLCAWLVWPAASVGRALVRFIHALPGVGAAQIEVSQGHGLANLGTIGFSQITRWHSLRSGRFHWSVVKGQNVLAAGSATVGNGAYDMVLLARASGVSLGIFRDQAGRSGTSLLRVINAAPELGAPELKLDAALLAASASFTHGTAYTSVNPGVHTLTALKTGSVAPLVKDTTLRLTPDHSYTALLVGSAGRRLSVVTVTDRGAPLTRSAPLTPTAPRELAAGRSEVVVVMPGDSLWSIARDRLGPSASNEAVYQEVLAIWSLNAERIGTGDPNLIFPGQHIVLPKRRAS